MADFRLRAPVDAAICMQDSQGHLLTNERLLAHLRAVARALRPGGLYVFEPLHDLVVDRPGPPVELVQAAGAADRARVVLGPQRRRPRLPGLSERMELEAIENGTRRLYRQSHLSRMVFPRS